MILLEHLPTNTEMWEETISRRREEYKDQLEYATERTQSDSKLRTENQDRDYNQIKIDVLRT